MSNTLPLSPDQLLTTTRAVRKRLDFDRPVPLALIRECLEIALQAPTGSNAQGWQWMVVQDPAKRLALAELYRKAWAIYPSMAASAHQVHAADPSMQQVQERVVSSAEYLANNLEKAPIFVIPCISGRVEGIPAPMGVVAQAIWVLLNSSSTTIRPLVTRSSRSATTPRGDRSRSTTSA